MRGLLSGLQRLCLSSPQSYIPQLKSQKLPPHVWRHNHHNPRDITEMLSARIQFEQLRLQNRKVPRQNVKI